MKSAKYSLCIDWLKHFTASKNILGKVVLKISETVGTAIQEKDSKIYIRVFPSRSKGGESNKVVVKKEIELSSHPQYPRTRVLQHAGDWRRGRQGGDCGFENRQMSTRFLHQAVASSCGIR